MSLIDRAIEDSVAQTRMVAKNSGQPPAPKLVIVTCMDPRLTGILQALGLEDGDADVIRNAGS